MDYVALGKAIRKKRLEYGWKIAELAEKANISDDFVGKIERADGIPSIQTIVDIANALEVGLDYLMSEDLNAGEGFLRQEIEALLDGMDQKKRKLFLRFIQQNLCFFQKYYPDMEE